MADLFYSVTFKAAGQSYDASSDLVSVGLTQVEVGAVELVVRLEDPYRVLGTALQPGMDVELDLGTIADHSVLFAGRIYKVDRAFPPRGVPSLTITAYDGLMKLGLRKEETVWRREKVSHIVKAVLDAHHLGEPAGRLQPDPELTLHQVVNDLALLSSLASFMSCVMYARTDRGQTKVYFLPEKQEWQKDARLTLRPALPDDRDQGSALTSFQAQIDVAQLLVPRVYVSHDLDGKSISELEVARRAGLGASSSGANDRAFRENMTAFLAERPAAGASLAKLVAAARSTTGVIERSYAGQKDYVTVPGTMTRETLKEIAAIERPTRAEGKLASGEVQGTKELRAPMTVDIQGVGDPFSGKWFVSRARHVLDRDGYRTAFECRR